MAPPYSTMSARCFLISGVSIFGGSAICRPKRRIKRESNAEQTGSKLVSNGNRTGNKRESNGEQTGIERVINGNRRGIKRESNG